MIGYDQIRDGLVELLEEEECAVFLCEVVPGFKEHWEKWCRENDIHNNSIPSWMESFGVESLSSNNFRKYLVEYWNELAVMDCTYSEWYDEMTRLTKLFKENVMNDNRFAVIGVCEDGEIFLSYTNREDEDIMLTTLSNANRVAKKMNKAFPHICYNVVEVFSSPHKKQPD